MSRMISKKVGLGLFLYTLFAALVLGGMWQFRERTIRHYETPQAQREWQEWVELEKERAKDKSSAVLRKPSRSAEPPMLVMMRDRFPVVSGMTLVIGSVVLFFLIVTIRGAFAKKS